MEGETPNTEAVVPEKSEADSPEKSETAEDSHNVDTEDPGKTETVDEPAETDEEKKSEVNLEKDVSKAEVTADEAPVQPEEIQDEGQQEVKAEENETTGTTDEQKDNKEAPGETPDANKAELGADLETAEMKAEGSQRDTPECLIKDEEKGQTTPEIEPSTTTDELAESAAETSTEKVNESLSLPPEPPAEPYSDTNPSPEPSPEPQSKTSPELTMVTEHSDAPPPAPQPISVVHRSAHPSRTGVHNTSLTLNQMAIATSAQNKLPISRIKGILERVGRHTESSAKKRGGWYKSETSYVDVNSYSWKNLALYKDYQQHMWTGDGALRSTCKK